MNLCDNDGRSPLYIACENGHENTAKILVDNGSIVNLCDDENCNSLCFVCLNGYEKNCVAFT